MAGHGSAEAAVVLFTVESWGAGNSVIEADLRSGAGYVSRFGNDISGYIAFSDHQEPEYSAVPWTLFGRVAVIHCLMVLPRCEGRGLGQSLMQLAERRAKEMGFDCLRLDAFTQNPRALAFYERGSYRRVGQVRFRKGLFDCFEKGLHKNT
jgi:ribosomal protein S18 acetylase RimI-like enzyme